MNYLPYQIVENIQTNDVFSNYKNVLEVINEISEKTNRILTSNSNLKNYNLYNNLNKDLKINFDNEKTAKNILNVDFNNKLEYIEFNLKKTSFYNEKNLAEAIELRKELAEMVFEKFDEQSIESAINIKNSILSDIISDMRYQEKEFLEKKLEYNSNKFYLEKEVTNV
ncbi:hypothetical protein I6G41_01050 [Staphylococcus equorum]|uniref:hypothetical protein n=1 Tax=Staphylococcus equorum TaxID=246432 RepID=UPI0018D8229A|nr:hypothetical protein [Staphylococcus equorum]QPS99701.1 hypothetical protein I6G41_01050 [Staphylococcus equorum]